MFLYNLYYKFKNLNFSWKIWIVGSIFIVFIAFLLWLPQYGKLPAGLNRDEAALGYNAYSLLKTGKDEWGKSWPISITSFGDQKLPVYVYTLIPLIEIFNLEIWVVRLPSLLVGFIIIISIGLLGIKLIKSIGFSSKTQLYGSWLAMIFSATSPWQMHFSRVAYESHLALGLFLGAFTCLLYAIDTNRIIFQRILLIKAGLLFGLTLLTYHSYQIFTPLFLFAILLIFFKKIKKLDKIGLGIAVFLGIVSIGLLLGSGIVQANKIKSIGTSFFNKQVLLSKATQYRSFSHFPTIINKLFFNKFSEGSTIFTQNYLSTLSSTFLFIRGSGHGDHNPGDGNNFHIFLAPLILSGMFAIKKYFKNNLIRLIFIWILLAPIPAALTVNPNIEVRLATLYPALELLAVIGFIYLLKYRSLKQRIFLSVLLLIFAAHFTIRLFIFYTKISPQTAVDNTNYHKLAKTLFKYKSNFRSVLTQAPAYTPYIWYLFENKIDPALAQKTTIHYPATNEGFIYVKQIENIKFENIQWHLFPYDPLKKPQILIVKPGEVPLREFNNFQYKLLETISDENNKVIYEVWKTD